MLLKLKSVLLIIIYAFLFSCSDETDYRDEVVGMYEFETIYSIVGMCYEPSDDCIDGWKESILDTIRYTSNIEKYSSNQLIIKFGEGTIGTLINDEELTYTLFPEYENGTLIIENDQNIHHSLFNGYFNNEELTINMQFGLGIGGYKKYIIKGTRIN